MKDETIVTVIGGVCLGLITSLVVAMFIFSYQHKPIVFLVEEICYTNAVDNNELYVVSWVYEGRSSEVTFFYPSHARWFVEHYLASLGKLQRAGGVPLDESYFK